MLETWTMWKMERDKPEVLGMWILTRMKVIRGIYKINNEQKPKKMLTDKHNDKKNITIRQNTYMKNNS